MVRQVVKINRFLSSDKILHAEFAEYTSAQERIALGKKARKKAAVDRRTAMQELIADAYVIFSLRGRCKYTEQMSEMKRTRRPWNGNRNNYGEVGTVRRSWRLPQPRKCINRLPVRRHLHLNTQNIDGHLVPPIASLPTLTPALTRLSGQLAKITTSHVKNTAALENIAQEREAVEKREKEMREMVGSAEEKRAWFESFRDWVESVAGFLDEKVGCHKCVQTIA